MKGLVLVVAIVAIKCINASGEDDDYNIRLYVSGLSYSVDDDVLREMFTPFGTVSFGKVIRDLHSGRSKGLGFVEMSTLEEAKEAVEALNGSVHEERIIMVSEAKLSGSGH